MADMIGGFVVAAPGRRTVRTLHLGRAAAPEVSVPVGPRHAVDSGTHGPGGYRQALCGADLAGWHLFLDLPFTGRDGGECRRCEQVIRSSHRGADDERAAASRQPSGPARAR